MKLRISELEYRKGEGEILPPWYYGLAYREDWAYVSVFYPIPLNFIIRFGMWIAHQWNWWRSKPTWVDRQVELYIKVELMKLRNREEVVDAAEIQVQQLTMQAEMLLRRMHQKEEPS